MTTRRLHAAATARPRRVKCRRLQASPRNGERLGDRATAAAWPETHPPFGRPCSASYTTRSAASTSSETSAWVPPASIRPAGSSSQSQPVGRAQSTDGMRHSRGLSEQVKLLVRLRQVPAAMPGGQLWPGWGCVGTSADSAAGEHAPPHAPKRSTRRPARGAGALDVAGRIRVERLVGQGPYVHAAGDST
jgi:hypothetical protein